MSGHGGLAQIPEGITPCSVKRHFDLGACMEETGPRIGCKVSQKAPMRTEPMRNEISLTVRARSRLALLIDVFPDEDPMNLEMSGFELMISA